MKMHKPICRILSAVFVTSVCCNWTWGQTLTTRPATPVTPSSSVSSPAPAPEESADSISLTVPAGTPLKVALDQEVRLRKVGQPIHGKVVEPVYSFDKIVIPAGSDVTGKVAGIDGVSKMKRTVAAMNANFSPYRQVHIEFDELVMADGRHLPLHTVVSPASQGVLQFIPANAKENTGAAAQAKHAASRKISDARQEAKRQWDAAMQQLHEPGKMHRLERLGVSQLPLHPQYMDAGTSFNADLQTPLDFGTEPLKADKLSSIGNPPPSGSVVHALLMTPLSSATAKKGEAVEAVISQPLVVSRQLFLPQGSHIKGTVLQVRPARRLNRNGQLRVVFHQVVPPDGIEQKVEASLEGVQVAKGEHLSLDAEGGAQVTTPRTRYLTTAIAVALAASSMSPDHDARFHGGDGGGDPGAGAANGASGFGFLGTIAGAAAHSRVVASGFGAYGAAMSVYAHFLARGRDVVYPKDMSMVIGLGTRDTRPSGQAVFAPSNQHGAHTP
ncbi:MAG: hypothetical protein WB711_25420 [Terriglobales bacterium]